jgi:hypothetical protein
MAAQPRRTRLCAMQRTAPHSRILGGAPSLADTLAGYDNKSRCSISSACGLKSQTSEGADASMRHASGRGGAPAEMEGLADTAKSVVVPRGLECCHPISPSSKTGDARESGEWSRDRCRPCGVLQGVGRCGVAITAEGSRALRWRKAAAGSAGGTGVDKESSAAQFWLLELPWGSPSAACRAAAHPSCLGPDLG